MSDTTVGDVDIPSLEVAPADGTTTAVLVLRGPDGSETTVPATPTLATSGGTQVFEGAPVVYTEPGWWVLDWTITGTGQGTKQQRVYVAKSPVAGGPTWWPTRAQVANYIPSRTLAVNPAAFSEAGEEHLATWGPATRPTGVQVDGLIADQGAWAATRLPGLTTANEAAAAGVVAMLVAAAIERGWPDSDSTSLQRASDLEKRALDALSSLVAVNDEATGETGDGSVAPVYSFPTPVSWGDQLL